MATQRPRKILWEDTDTLGELMEDPLLYMLHKGFCCLDHHALLFPMDELKILNETGYQLSWLLYESRNERKVDMERFMRNVYAATGIGDHAMAVVSLVYTAMCVASFPPIEIHKHTKRELKRLHSNSWCSRSIDCFVQRLQRDGFSYRISFYGKLKAALEYNKQLREEEPTDLMCAKSPAVAEDNKYRERSFTLDQIVAYAAENLTVDSSLPIMTMLYNLMKDDGTQEERDKVNSIIDKINLRNIPKPTFEVKRMEVEVKSPGNIIGKTIRYKHG